MKTLDKILLGAALLGSLTLGCNGKEEAVRQYKVNTTTRIVDSPEICAKDAKLTIEYGDVGAIIYVVYCSDGNGKDWACSISDNAYLYDKIWSCYTLLPAKK